MISAENWTNARNLIDGASRIAVCCHVAPDGDALGSMIGLGRFLARSGKEVFMSWGAEVPQIPPQYAFMPRLDEIVSAAQVPGDLDLFIAVDCADAERLELLKPQFDSASSTINIDHHVSNEGFADVNLIDAGAASTCELVFELVTKSGGVPDPEEATCLYTGIVTDTGRFQYASTSPATLRAAAELRELGVDHGEVNAEVYESNSFHYLHALGVVLFRAQLEDGMVWSRLDQRDLGGLEMDETEHFIDNLRAVRESKMAVLLKEVEDGTWKISMRSRGAVDVAKIAKALGGGGHERAAGFEMPGTPEEVVAAIRSLVPND